MSMTSLDKIACAGEILRRGQEKGEGRSGAYGQALRQTHDAKDPGPSGCVLADARYVAPLNRWSHRFARRSLRIANASTQRRQFLSSEVML
jgi:hypothetical protein